MLLIVLLVISLSPLSHKEVRINEGVIVVCTVKVKGVVAEGYQEIIVVFSSNEKTIEAMFNIL